MKKFIITIGCAIAAQITAEADDELLRMAIERQTEVLEEINQRGRQQETARQYDELARTLQQIHRPRYSREQLEILLAD